MAQEEGQQHLQVDLGEMGLRRPGMEAEVAEEDVQREAEMQGIEEQEPLGLL